MRSVIFVALVLIVHVTARVKNPRVDGVSSACPGGNITCPSSMTCCELRDHSYGCCPFKNAVCCRDGVHCCPGGMQCDLEEGKCQQKSDVPLKRLLVSERANDMCPDRKSQCPSGTTCCQMSTGDYGCCPMPNAVCCSDRLHCCPSGFTCNTSAGKCYQHESNIEIPWYRKFSARPFQQSMVDENNEESESSEEIRIDEELIPMHKLSIPQPKITSLQDELCPGGRTKCPSGATCCLVSMGSYGCCPMPHATCCADRRHCCPAGLQCDVTGQKCYSETEDLVIASKKKFAATPLRHKEGIHYIAEEDDISDEILSEEEESVEDVKLCGAIRCPTKATCCSVRDPTTGQMRSRCCPLTNAVCCPNHCCPFGFECRGKKKCEKKATRHAIIDFYN